MNHQRPSMLTAAAIGGAFLGVTSALPLISALNCVCCGLIVAGGAIAAYFYLRDFPADLPYPTYGDIAQLGLFTGLIGAIVWIAIELPMHFLMMHLGIGLNQIPTEVLDDPEIPAGVRQIVQQLFSGGIGPLFIVITVVSSLVFSLIFATLGAIIGYAIFSRRVRPAAPVPPTYPPIYVPPTVPPGPAPGGSETRPPEPSGPAPQSGPEPPPDLGQKRGES